MNTCVQINLQFSGIGILQSMAQNSNTEATSEEIKEIITSDYESLYNFSKLNSSAECRQCKIIYKTDQRKTGYKTLSEHYHKPLNNLFEEILSKRRSDNLEDNPSVKNFLGGKNVETIWIDQIKKTASMACCSQHPVLMNVFNDPCIHWTTGFKCFNDTVRREIVKGNDELRTAVLKSLKKSSILIAFDGWTYTVKKEKHLSFVLFQVKSGSTPIFWKRMVMKTQTAFNASTWLQENKSGLRLLEINTIAVFADNASAPQLKLPNL